MITIVSGVPGSGKSYYGVDFIYKHKKKYKNNVLHNIDGLTLGSTIDDYCSKTGNSPSSLISDTFHKNDNSFHGWLFIIDEAQTLIPKNLRDDNIMRFFQMHRHYGIDVILITQDFKLLCPAISVLAELQLRAVSDTANPLPGSFLYKKMVGYESVGRVFLRKNKKVFAMYKTSNVDQDSVVKKSRPMLYLFLVVVTVMIVGLYFLFSLRDGLNSPSGTLAAEKKLKGFPEKYKISKPQSNRYDNYSEVTYPESLSNKFGGQLLPVSHITDHRGTIILLSGIAYPLADFPYPLRSSILGIYAVLPADVYDYTLDYRSNLPEFDSSLRDTSPSDNYDEPPKSKKVNHPIDPEGDQRA